MSIEIIKAESLSDFISQVKARNISLVKFRHQGTTIPQRQGTGWVLQPVLQMTTTAYDSDAHVIVRWEEALPSGKTTDYGLLFKSDRIRNTLEAASLSVSDGEWTPEMIASSLYA